MNLEYPLFLVNYKNYEGTVGGDGLAYARTVERVSEATGATLAVSPGAVDVRLLARETDVPVVAQAADPITHGRGTGAVPPEALVAAGAEGVVVNHPERRQGLDEVRDLLDRCRDAGLDAIVCVDSVSLGRAVAQLDPDCLLLEQPEDIGTDRAITTAHPDLVERFVGMVDEENPRTKVLVGGGIGGAADVRAGFELGADAAGAASAALGADDREEWIREVAEAMP